MTLRLAELALAVLAVGLFVGCSRGRNGEESAPPRPAACAGVADLDPLQPPTVDQVAALLAEVRALAADTVAPRAADARLLGLVPRARQVGAGLARDGEALSRLARDLQAEPAAEPSALAPVATAAAAAGKAEALLGSDLAQVERIDDLVVAAQVLAADPLSASAQRALVLRWAATSCPPRDGG